MPANRLGTPTPRAAVVARLGPLTFSARPADVVLSRSAGREMVVLVGATPVGDLGVMTVVVVVDVVPTNTAGSSGRRADCPLAPSRSAASGGSRTVQPG